MAEVNDLEEHLLKTFPAWKWSCEEDDWGYVAIRGKCVTTHLVDLSDSGFHHTVPWKYTISMKLALPLNGFIQDMAVFAVQCIIGS